MHVTYNTYNFQPSANTNTASAEPASSNSLSASSAQMPISPGPWQAHPMTARQRGYIEGLAKRLDANSDLLLAGLTTKGEASVLIACLLTAQHEQQQEQQHERQQQQHDKQRRDGPQ